MAALTTDWARAQVGDVPVRRSIIVPVKAATKILGGSLVSIVVAAGQGWARPSPGANTDRTIGVAGSVVDNTNGANGDVNVVCNRGTFLFRNDPAAPVLKENVGAICNVLDDQTATMAATGQTMGKVTGIKNDLVEVEIV